MRKYGVANFYIEPLETCPIENLDAKEVYYIKVFDSTNKTKGYNVSLGGGEVLQSLDDLHQMHQS